MAKTSALGRGLGALIDDADNINKSTTKEFTNEISISKIEANPFQPRNIFKEEALLELAQSIEKLGVIQPITLRKLENSHYQLISGERRFRACKLLGLKRIPAYIRNTADNEMLELALVENIQREDLDAIEVAISYQRLIEECKLTQENLSDKVGKKRSTISNYLRLLKLPAEIQKSLRDKQISMGHARALINISEQNQQLMVFHEALRHELSVRKVEQLVRDLNNGSKKLKEKKINPSLSQEYTSLQKHLSEYFKATVDLKRNSQGKGKITISFKSDDELEKIISVLDK